MRGLMKIYLKYIGSAIATIFVFLMIVGGLAYHMVLKIHEVSDGQVSEKYSVEKIADTMEMDAAGRLQNPEKVKKALREVGAAFAMVLQSGGKLTWSYRLPKSLNHSYSVGEVSAFSKWYLDDYPIFTWKVGEQLLVLAYPRGSVWRYNAWQDYKSMEVAMNFPKTLFLSLVILFLLVIGWLGYRYYRKMKVLAEAICDLSSGKEVQLSENGSTGEIAHSINETSDRLQKQMEMLRKRDAARTQWISGVSHDIRTPLSLILGYSNLLEEKQQSREEIQREAGLIRQESLRIRDLIEDLNLTSKLEYHMQPLRVGRTVPVKILRKVMADVMNSIAMDQGKYEIRVEISEEFERQQVNLDEKLVERAFRNVVENAIYHNEKGCGITVEAGVFGEFLKVVVTDTGGGIPEVVCKYINDGGREPDWHIMGLRIVKQIVEAHGGRVQIRQAGHRVEILIPIQRENFEER